MTKAKSVIRAGVLCDGLELRARAAGFPDDFFRADSVRTRSGDPLVMASAIERMRFWLRLMLVLLARLRRVETDGFELRAIRRDLRAVALATASSD